MKARVALALLVAALAAAALPAAGGATNECRGIPVCIRVAGPWVAIQPHSESVYLLECPRRRGVVGGVDALTSRPEVRVSFEARLGSPVAPGTTTDRDAFFRGTQTVAQRGSFQPRIGCIPAGGGGRATTSARATRPGLPFDRRAATVRVVPGTVRRAAQGCAPGEQLVGSWHAIAFRTKREPNLELLDALRVTRTLAGGAVVVTVRASEALPASAHAEVQVGAVCAR